jgi:membrane protease YdiL (CAAX protease family)
MADPSPALPPETPTPALPVPPMPNNIFRGPNGIRAGWRVVIFLSIVGAMAGIGSVIVGLLLRSAGGRPQFAMSMLTPLGVSISEGIIFLLTAVAALIMARMEHRKFGEYGLPARFAFREDFWIGTFVGFAAISVSLFAIFAMHGFRLAGIAIHGTTVITATLAWSATFVLVGLAEEFAFRGYLQFTLTTGIGFWPSAILLSAMFGLAHGANPGETKFGLLSVVCFAMLFCLFLRRTGNLWWAVGFHAGWDWGQTFFYGVPDSGLAPYHNLFTSSFSGPQWLTGGSVGPEASIFTPLTLLIVAIVFSRIYRENRYHPLGTRP